MLSTELDIHSQARSFKTFLRDVVLDTDTWAVLKKLVQENDVYVFSGIIRDFLLGEYCGTRDFDCVLNDQSLHNVSVIDYIRSSVNYRVNSFGGMKIVRPNLVIDVWNLRDTWGVKQENLPLSPQELIKTGFFNFSSIVYNLKTENFIFDQNFVNFLENRSLDIVYPKNPNIALCFVNIFYYQLKYDLKLSFKLLRWMKENYQYGMDLESVQVKHFNQVIFKQSNLDFKILNLINLYNEIQNRLG